jgi:hypothetical protein
MDTLIYQPSRSIRIYVGLIIVLAVLAAANTFLPQGSFTAPLSAEQLPASKYSLA